MRFGFTGTQMGMTCSQLKVFELEFDRECEALTHSYSISIEFHHGDCVGADFQAHNIVKSTGFSLDDIWIHPCTIHNKRAHCKSNHIDIPRPPLERNDIIVNLCDVIFATPFEHEEQRRSGTWYTIRRVRRYQGGFVSKKLIIIYPDGGIDVTG